MQTTLENKKKNYNKLSKKCSQEEEQSWGRRSLKFKSEERTRKHIFKGTENDEGQSGTICNTNSGKGSATSVPGS